MNKRAKNKSVGFAIQRDITADGATIHLRITNPRRLDSQLLWSTLKRYFMGGYSALILDQGMGRRKRLNFVDFLSALKATYEESQFLRLERKLIRDRVTF